QVTSSDPEENRKVKCVTTALLKAMGENPSEWEIKVFKDPTPNAFALPGKNVGVHTGMMSLVANQDQLAAVIGHEIGHVLAHHGNERVSQGMLTQAGLQVADAVLGKNSKNDKYLMAALGMGAQVGILLPFSRKQETEADRLGLEYMAKAGFDPRQAPELWKLMKAKGGGGGPEFLSTHPSSDSRIADLSERAPGLMPAYESSQKAHCF
ncbi:MAG TPA: peptidase, partial [Bdellovibrionales bacterium]|nr:peptidase [Bdellovibrionales bacterium]